MRVLFIKKALMFRILVFAVVLVGAVFFAKALLDPGTETFSADVPANEICRVATTGKQVALTIDTSFGEDQTEELLDILSEYNVTVTFAVMGVWAEQNIPLVKQMSRAGHEVISHSMMHERYPDLSAEAVRDDVLSAKAVLLTLAGVDSTFIRAPYGAYDQSTLAVLEECGLTPIKWSVDSRDWEGAGADAVVNNVIGNIQAGDIVVFQNNTVDTVEALPRILEALGERNFDCVRISDMVLKEGYSVDDKGVQKELA